MLNLLLAGDQAATSSQTSSASEQISNCSLCAEKGQIVKLKLCQINHEEAIFICPTQEVPIQMHSIICILSYQMVFNIINS